MVLDDIPLIDDSHSIDEVSLLVEKIKANRPMLLHGNSPASGFYFNPLGLDSPDIFKLRAPLVSHSLINFDSSYSLKGWFLWFTKEPYLPGKETFISCFQVSCENILTPGISSELLIAKQI